MKKRNKTYRILKAVAIAASTPIILLWMLVVVLYIPPVQRYAVNKVCHEVSNASGFDISIESFHLDFPLKVSIAGFEVSRNDTTFAKGEHADANISFTPLLAGEVEVNYISLEKTAVNTADLIPGIHIDGEIGFFRTIARNIDLEKEVVNLRQINIHSTDINITLNDTTETADEESTPLNWVINLHRGSIENCKFALNMPNDTMRTGIDIGKLLIRNGKIDLGKEIYGINAVAMSNTKVRYDVGNGSKENEPLNHIELDNINIACKDIEYTPDSTQLELHRFNFVQPGGIRITNASATLFADKEKLDIRDFAVNSKNGSYVKASTALPWSALFGNEGCMDANLALAVNKKDLSALLTKEQMEALKLFDNDMFKGTFCVKGNMSYIDIDTVDITIPAIARLQANGHASNLNEPSRIEAMLNLNSHAMDIKHFLGETANDSTPSATIDAAGNITYASNAIATDLKMTGIGGHIDIKASYDTNKERYNADIEFADIDASTLLKELPLKKATGTLSAEGEGFDIFGEEMRYDIGLQLDTVIYDNIKLTDISLDANQSKHISDISLTSNANYLKFDIKAETELLKEKISNNTAIDVSEADFMMLGISDAEVGTRIKMNIEASTDMQESHALKLSGKNIAIATQYKTFTPADIDFDFYTAPDSSCITASNGDLHIQGMMKSGYNGLFKSIDRIGEMFKEATNEKENTLYYIHDYAKEIPDVSLEFECGKQNMLHNFLAINEISINNMNLDIAINENKGININSGVYGFKKGELNLDTIRFFAKQNDNNIRYLAGVRSTAMNPKQQKMTFSSMLYGNIFNDSVTTNFMFRDKKEGVGVYFGIKTLVKPNELNLSFRPKAIFLNNRFNFNQENYITLKSNGTISADVTLSNESEAGMHLYTTPDGDSKLNANLELFNINLSELTSVVPLVPDIAGILNLELYLNKGKDDMMLSSDIRIDSVAYEGTHIGNEALEIVYFPKDKKTHYLDMMLSHNDEEVARLSGDYLDDANDPGLKGEISLTRFPLGITQAFTKESGMSLNGYVNSELSAEGKLSSLSTDGFIQFDSVYLNAPLFGTDLHLSDKKVTIDNNRITFRNFDIFAKGENPFKLNGTVDLNTPTNPAFNLRMNATDYELVNAPRTRGSMLYGRMFIDFRAFISGALNSMKVYGNATLLGKSNITYVLPDAPITTDKELDGLVEFVNFQDTAKVKNIEEEADFGNMNISLGLKIEDGARINADLDANRNSYVMLRGGGNLNMTYTSDDGLNVTGTYAMSDGELKYELPIIPLKTFNIIDGSKVTWSGDVLDPTLDITAIERITTSVNIDDSGMQPVAFDVGVKLSNTLSNMGLTFTISAPDNAVVQDQLNSLDAETLNKYAVTMLITGTYIGNTKGMTVSNALSSFLDAKINDLAGTAMKSVSVNVGINDAENAETGSTYKNYSFSLKKRFWNDRLTIIIGGEVNSGDHPTTNDSFINNVSLEWKISENSNRYLRLFYDKNYESLLEGEIIETGVGYVYKKKLQNLRELFVFKKKNKKQPMPSMSKRGERNRQPKGEKE